MAAVEKARVAPAEVRTVACIGAGTIGGGWVAYFLARGYDVRAYDPAPDAADRLLALVDAAWPAYAAGAGVVVAVVLTLWPRLRRRASHG